jgi:hypothetical protein
VAGTLLLGAMSSVPTVAIAGLIDSPLPVLAVGQTTVHMFSIPGVIKNNNLETVFICSSLSSQPVTVAVEVFATGGGAPLNDANLPSLSGVEVLAPGTTKTITTGSTAAFHEDQTLALPAASLRNGSARIVSTSKSIACSAFITDQISDPPISMMPLRLISRKQRGD